MKIKSEITKEKDRARSRAWYAKHKDEIRPKKLAKQKIWYALNREAIRTKRKTITESPEYKAKVSAYGRLRNYGLTREEFQSRLYAQGGKCAICKTSEWGKRGPHVDHDHRSGAVRALLCHDCNLALGFVKDDPVIIAQMLNYIIGGGFQNA